MERKELDKRLKEFLCLIDEEIIIADGLSYAFVGLTKVNGNIVSVYSTHIIVDEIMKQDCIKLDEAENFVQFNIVDAYAGTRTPIFVDFVPQSIWNDE